MNTQTDENTRLKLLSYLLMYPCNELRGAVDDLAKISDSLFPQENDSRNQRIRAFLNHLKENSVLGLQEIYTAAFDLNPGTCLNLSYHTRGDGKKRGKELVRLQEYYDQAGYLAQRAELPDYLPMVLEFLSFCQNDVRDKIMEGYAEAVGKIASELRKGDIPYAGILEIIHDIFEKKS